MTVGLGVWHIGEGALFCEIYSTSTSHFHIPYKDPSQNKLSRYQDRNSNYKEKVSQGRLIFIVEIAIPRKTVFILRRGPESYTYFEPSINSLYSNGSTPLLNTCGPHLSLPFS